MLHRAGPRRLYEDRGARAPDRHSRPRGRRPCTPVRHDRRLLTFLIQKIEALGDGIFVGDPNLQVVGRRWFPDPDEMFRSPTSPRRPGDRDHHRPGRGDDDLALRRQRRAGALLSLRGDRRRTSPRRAAGRDPPYAFGGEAVLLDAAQVWDMDDDPRIEKYRPGSSSRRIADQFGYAYTLLLNSLHRPSTVRRARSITRWA